MTTTIEKFEPTVRPAQSLAGKYLTFFLGAESYGLPVIKVREIISFLPPTHVPQLPEHVEGVINLRGKIIPVLNLRRKFGLSAGEPSKRTCTVVVQIQSASKSEALIGLVVDGVEEVAQISAADLEPTPEFGPGAATHHILGMAKVKGVIKTLLNLDQVIPFQLNETAACKLDPAALAQ